MQAEYNLRNKKQDLYNNLQTIIVKAMTKSSDYFVIFNFLE